MGVPNEVKPQDDSIHQKRKNTLAKRKLFKRPKQTQRRNASVQWNTKEMLNKLSNHSREKGKKEKYNLPIPRLFYKYSTKKPKFKHWRQNIINGNPIMKKMPIKVN